MFLDNKKTNSHEVTVVQLITKLLRIELGQNRPMHI